MNKLLEASLNGTEEAIVPKHTKKTSEEETTFVRLEKKKDNEESGEGEGEEEEEEEDAPNIIMGEIRDLLTMKDVAGTGIKLVTSYQINSASCEEAGDGGNSGGGVSGNSIGDLVFLTAFGFLLVILFVCNRSASALDSSKVSSTFSSWSRASVAVNTVDFDAVVIQQNCWIDIVGHINSKDDFTRLPIKCYIPPTDLNIGHLQLPSKLTRSSGGKGFHKNPLRYYKGD